MSKTKEKKDVVINRIPTHRNQWTKIPVYEIELTGFPDIRSARKRSVFGGGFIRGAVCGRQTFASVEVASAWITRLDKLGIAGVIERCGTCGMIHVKETKRC